MVLHTALVHGNSPVKGTPLSRKSCAGFVDTIASGVGVLSDVGMSLVAPPRLLRPELRSTGKVHGGAFHPNGGKTILEIKGCQRRVIARRFRCRSCGGQSVGGEVGSLGVVPSMSQELPAQGVKTSLRPWLSGWRVCGCHLERSLLRHLFLLCRE